MHDPCIHSGVIWSAIPNLATCARNGELGPGAVRVLRYELWVCRNARELQSPRWIGLERRWARGALSRSWNLCWFHMQRWCVTDKRVVFIRVVNGMEMTSIPEGVRASEGPLIICWTCYARRGLAPVRVRPRRRLKCRGLRLFDPDLGRSRLAAGDRNGGSFRFRNTLGMDQHHFGTRRTKKVED